ncbi:MAG: carbon-nitrogen hydrolase family protein [Candidatus Omnitrophica bacterium]|nr:carbon-nitrogen hydrolase family protein [Candidatus Omnitrophota bacterium]
MKKYLKVAAIQLNPNEDSAGNIEKAVASITNACEKGVELVILPELFIYRGDPKRYKEVAERINGPITSFFMSLAKQLRVNIVLGSILERSSQMNRYYDTTVYISSRGEVCAHYRKINLFHIKFNKKIINEKKYFLEGRKIVSSCIAGHTIGFAICFDLRFPDLFHCLRRRQTEILCIPSNFTHATGRAHWQVLLRNRAIETQSFIIAANCCGKDPYTHTRSFGHSMIVDPWGRVLAEMGEKEGLITAEIDFGYLKKIRKRLPIK